MSTVDEICTKALKRSTLTHIQVALFDRCELLKTFIHKQREMPPSPKGVKMLTRLEIDLDLTEESLRAICQPDIEAK